MQGSRCNAAVGSCLHQQLYDFYQGDVGRIAGGLTPLYFVGRYGGGTNNSNQVGPVAVIGEGARGLVIKGRWQTDYAQNAVVQTHCGR